MSSTGADVAERFLQRVLAPVCLLSGAVVLSGFFFPGFVGSVVSGTSWLVVALLFFGSGLGYLAVFETGGDDGDRFDVGTLRALRRRSWTDQASRFLARQDAVTFGVPVAVFGLFFAVQLAFPAGVTAAITAVETVLLRDVGWLFLAAMFLAVLYCLLLLLGPWGEIKLGGPETEPAYTYPTYFSLVFTAGIAAGIVFWGPAETLYHYRTPPPAVDAAPRSEGAILGALTYALFHWGVSAWSAYTVVAVPIAYFVYDRGAPLRVSTILTPFLGVDGLDSAWAKLVDTLAVFATIGGIATSIALVGEQFLAGITVQWGVTTGRLGPLLFVGGLTLVYVLSAVTGIHRGIRRIAGLNVVLFGLFGVLLAALGPRSFVVDRGSAALGNYALSFVSLSLFPAGEWATDWTVWNWSWWFSWAPFAGLFLAALSRGRRIRTVVFTGVVATSAATMVWFLLFGGTSLYVQHSGAADVLGAIAARGGSEAVAGFPIFAALPLGQLLTFLFLALIVVFITTSADTSTLVVAILGTKRGLAPSTGSVVFWGVLQGVVAVAVLLVGDGGSLQTAAVLTGGPFAVLSVVAIAGLALTFHRDEGGHTSVVGAVRERLPTIQAHHDVDPPQDD
ncbi:BCCT family transporter [Halomicrococcus gelatinilyticus]|uniref:BCCT family transporter n=1 Tax=Halomicrococcus gelatinilyticus TaxID=1702103 RepID=UPI002E140B5E